MANPSESIGPLDKLKRWMDGWFWMEKLKKGMDGWFWMGAQGSSVEDEIEQSKVHWSELAEHDNDGNEVAEVSNVEVFKSLQSHPSYGHFFRTFGDGGVQDNGELVVGEKFAEGGQAKLYHVRVNWKIPEFNSRDYKRGVMWVLKVFKKGTFLKDLQKQWPQGIFRQYEEIVQRAMLGKSQPIKCVCDINCGTLLPNGRFAFLLVRETGDLRTFIDRAMKEKLSLDCGPFEMDVALLIMYYVGTGVDWLHNLNIVHRDLKASNVLYIHANKNTNKENYGFYVADFECSIGTVGTGFFRAPEILQALRDKNVYKTPNLFTKASDVYSYGMVCYEILTGKLPFEGHSIRDFDLVLSGQRPEVPHYVDKWVHDLLQRCWQFDPSARPTLGEILKLLEAKSIRCELTRRAREERQMMPAEIQKSLAPKYEYES